MEKTLDPQIGNLDIHTEETFRLHRKENLKTQERRRKPWVSKIQIENLKIHTKKTLWIHRREIPHEKLWGSTGT